MAQQEINPLARAQNNVLTRLLNNNGPIHITVDELKPYVAKQSAIIGNEVAELILDAKISELGQRQEGPMHVRTRRNACN